MSQIGGDILSLLDRVSPRALHRTHSVLSHTTLGVDIAMWCARGMSRVLVLNLVVSRCLPSLLWDNLCFSLDGHHVPD